MMPVPVSRRNRVLAMSGSCLALFLIFLDNTVVNVALPTLQRRLAAQPDELEWAVNAYVVAFAGLVLLAGRMGDRFGRRQLFVAGLGLFAAASAAAALAGGPIALISARAGQGVGAALLAPLSLSILTEVFPAEQLAVAVGIWAGVSGLGLAVGPLVGGLLVEHAGWQSIFWLNLPLCAMAIGLTLAAGVRSPTRQEEPVDALGAGLISVGLVAAVAALTHAVRHPWTSAWTVGLLAVAAAAVAAFAWQQHRHPAPLILRAWRREPAIRAALAVLSLASFALFGTLWFLSLYLQNVRGFSAVEAGVRTLPLTLTTLFVAPIAGKVAARRGPYALLVAGVLITGFATLRLTTLTATTGYAGLAATLATLGTGLAILMPTAVSVVLDRVPSHRAGAAAGVVISARQLGGAVGLAALATIGSRAASAGFTSSTGLHGLGALVGGGQIGLIGSLKGAAVATSAANSFVHGITVAMWVATGACALAGVVLLKARAALRPVADAQIPVPQQASTSDVSTVPAGRP